MFAKRSPDVLEMFKFTRLFRDPDVWPEIPKQSLFSSNIHEVVVNCSPGSPNRRQLLATVHQVVGPTPKMKMGNICGKQSNVLRTFGDISAKIWRRLGELLAKCSPKFT